MCDTFFTEAEMLWRAEGYTDSINTAIALQLFSIGCLVNYKDDLSVQAIKEGRAMAERLKLFGTPPTIFQENRYQTLSSEWQRATSYAAWGIYIYLSYHAFFYEDKGIEYPPMYPMPGSHIHASNIVPEVQTVHGPVSLSDTAPFLAALCKLSIISQDIAKAYYADLHTPIMQRVPMAFVEAKFREMLAWTEGLPFQLIRGNETRPEVLVLQ